MKGLSGKFLLLLVILALVAVLAVPSMARKKKKLPVLVDSAAGKILVLPDPLKKFLRKNFPKYKIPSYIDYDPGMLRYFNSRLIGIHPGIAWGDFNKDKRGDYALLIVTAETPWGPQVELIILNGLRKKGGFEIFRMGEIYSFKEDYISYKGEKLYKGKYRQGGWHINWDKKLKIYVKHKS